MSTMKFQLVQDGKIWKVTLRAWESTRSEWPTRYKGKKCLQMEKNLDGSQLCFLTFFVAFFHILPKLTWRVWGSTFWKMEHLTDGLFYPHNHPNQVILQFLHPTRRWKTEPLSLLVGGAVPSPTPTDTEYLVGQNFQRWFWIGYPILMILCIYIYILCIYILYIHGLCTNDITNIHSLQIPRTPLTSNFTTCELQRVNDLPFEQVSTWIGFLGVRPLDHDPLSNTDRIAPLVGAVFSETGLTSVLILFKMVIWCYDSISQMEIPQQNCF